MLVHGYGRSEGQGTVTVDGITVTFTPSAVCIVQPDGSSFGGPGTTDSGELAYVDSGGHNQLAVYIGVDDPFEEPETLYDHADVMNDLAGLQVDGSTLTAQPDMINADTVTPVGTADLEVSCD